MTTTEVKKEGGRKSNPLYRTTRFIFLAGIGAVSMAQDEINRLLDNLVERGEVAESDARKMVREVVDRRDKLEQERREQAAKARKPEAATRTDIEALNARIAELTRQIEELRRAQQS